MVAEIFQICTVCVIFTFYFIVESKYFDPANAFGCLASLLVKYEYATDLFINN